MVDIFHVLPPQTKIKSNDIKIQKSDGKKILWIILMSLFLMGIPLVYYQVYENSTMIEQEQEIDTKRMNIPTHRRDKLVVCYYSIPNDMNSARGLDPSKINTRMCTHIIIGFGSVVNNIFKLNDASEFYTRILDLRKLDPTLKVMFSVGGINEPSNTGFGEMVKTRANRFEFIKSVWGLLKKYKMDGIDIDWEYPVWFSGNVSERMYFVQLLKELRFALDRTGQKLILSAAVAAPYSMISKCYDVQSVAKYVDFINLMSYDYHYYRRYYPYTGHNAPLFNYAPGFPFLGKLNVNYSANYWVSQGMPKNKIVVGIPTFGHSFHLFSRILHGIYAPVLRIGQLGSDGFVDFSMVCDFIKDGGETVFDRATKVPYTFKDKEWISFDNGISVEEKSKWIDENGFKGAMIFSLNSDDWNGTCDGKTTFPLTKIISRTFLDYDI